jgi:hypothetical protein
LEAEQGQHAFHIGERIPIILAFSSDMPDKYKLDGGTYDRGGRLGTEEFVMEKEATDPYIDYFGSGVLGGEMGGRRTTPVLGSEPAEVDLDLNEWFRFDAPGRYRLYLKSHRLTRESAPRESDQKTMNFAAVSNIIEIEILPVDAAWQARKVAELKEEFNALLDAPFRSLPGKDMNRAWRDLEYLGTAEAVQTAFEIMRRVGSSQHLLLLFAARDRKRMLEDFDAYLADARVAIQTSDIAVRAVFTWLEIEKPKPMPIFSWQYTEADIQKRRELHVSRRARFEPIEREQAARLIPLIEAKNPAARKTSAEAIATFAPAEAKAAQLIPPEDYGLTRGELITQFADFPEERQAELLGMKWDLVRGPEMIPVLRQVLAQPEGALKTPMFTAGSGGEPVVWVAALKRLAQLSPSEVIRLTKADILSGEPRISWYAVRELPAQSMPELDDALRVQLGKNYPAAMTLVAKLGSAGILDEVRKGEVADRSQCPLESVVNYLVRVAPEENGEGRAMLHKAMVNRKSCAYYPSLLDNVSAVVWSPAIQSEAIALLADPDANVARNAAFILAAHGGPEVEGALWKRLEEWSAEWRGRAAELVVHPITGKGPGPDGQLGGALSSSLAMAQSWRLDETRRQRLLALCADDSCREEWNRPEAPGRIQVSGGVNGGWTILSWVRVDNHSSLGRVIPLATWDALKGKLLQYPVGTRFCWNEQIPTLSNGFTPGLQREMLQDLTVFLSAHSMGIEECSQ